jgi:mRNA-degrading endonuclease RelE of RelBE toxin-antitoxin system
MEEIEKLWRVDITGKALKQRRKLPQSTLEALEALILDIRYDGPERRNWPHTAR